MSTAKSLATSYLNNKRNFNSNLSQGRNGHSNSNNLNSHRFKSSASNLATSNNIHHNTSITQQQPITAQQTRRLKSISMSNLTAEEQGSNHVNNNNYPSPSSSRIQRPASRNALDSIHNGMNAKYAQVQSKVLLQNIRPQATQPSNNAGSKIPATTSSVNRTRNVRSSTPASSGQVKVPSDKSALLMKLKTLEEELERQQLERENLKQELEREKGDKQEQLQQMKQELQEKLVEHDKQNEEYHQKLLEAYELADQNRRSADSVLSESRQRDEESRKRIEELEAQLVELKEFVSMKEEMTGKMYELREQIREERQRYEEQLKSLHQVFENEKIRSCQLSNSSELMSMSSGSKIVSLDHNSNYFNRTKQSLQSSESINKLADKDQQQQSNDSSNTAGCRKCSSGSVTNLHNHHHHASNQDMYGSKISTRIQSSAKSAWRSSKKLASSVITGGVGLSACRQCRGGKRNSSSTSSSNLPGADMSLRGTLNPAIAANTQQHMSLDSLHALSSNDDQHDMAAVVHNNHQPLRNLEEKHASMIEVKSSGSVDHLHQPLNHQANQVDQQQQQQVDNKQAASNEQQSGGLIRVNENNRTIVTILTKFNDSSAPESSLSPSNNSSVVSGGSGSEQSHQTTTTPPPVVASSERSRCESSSSGRGTSSSEAGSTAPSQNGDSLGDEQHQICGITTPHHQIHNHGLEQVSEQVTGDENSEKREKRHRRKSSLFKASKVFGGSQVSLNKLKTFFTPTTQVAISNSNSNNILHQSKLPIKSQTVGLAAKEQMENSRIRCMELNKAINGPTSTTNTNLTTTTTAEANITTTSSIEFNNSENFGESNNKCTTEKVAASPCEADDGGEQQAGQGGALNLSGSNSGSSIEINRPQQQVAALG